MKKLSFSKGSPMASPLSTTPDAITRAEALAQRCTHPTQTATGWMACCPAHEDTTPSLAIDPGDDKVLLYCFAGCPPEAIVHALGLTLADLFCSAPTHPNGNGQKHITHTYDYYDAQGTLLFQTVRYDHPKDFRQRRPDPVTPRQWIWDLKTVQPVLYNLPAVLAAVQAGTRIYICEGEKDADTLIARGMVATTCPMGAGKWRKHHSEALHGAHVAILPDNDPPGQKHALQIAAALQGIAVSVAIVPGLHTGAPGSDVNDWLNAGGTQEAFDAAVQAALQSPSLPPPPSGPAPPLGWSVAGVHSGVITMGMAADWRNDLFTKKNGEVLPNQFNLTHILHFHEYWKQPEHVLWHDTIRDRHMSGDSQITNDLLVKISHWFGGQERLPLTSFALLRDCLYERCTENPRDLLQSWLNNLPPWDHVPRLHTWLQEIATVEGDDAYAREMSRRLPVSLVARAMQPGCQYREVIILQGKENIGKSHIAETLVTKEWFIVLSMSLETKESHMMLQKSWLAELADLDSLSRTEDARLKAFITMEDDTYIPKYKNDTASFKRRTVFVGTTNEEQYLKGQTGNTRFLPVLLRGPILLERLHAMREQLFAEALQHYYAHRETWWHMPPEVHDIANEERERRRISNEYEQPLHDWLTMDRFASPIMENGQRVIFTPDETSFPEIARWFLKIEAPERWKDRSLQMQIGAALRTLGWKPLVARRNNRPTRIWQRSLEDNPVPF
jgi:hypothetical protein